MQLSQGRPIAENVPAPRPAVSVRPPALLIELAPASHVFLDNLGDLLLRRQPKLPALTSRPAPFWPDVFVAAGLPWRQLFRSWLFHLFVVVAIWGVSVTWLPRHAITVRSGLDKTELTYYSVSEYLPALDTGAPPEKKIERKGEPAHAKQRIISLPPAPDNFRQTIVSPNSVKLPREVQVPNIVAWTPVPSPVPIAAATASMSRLTLPRVDVTPVAPPPDVASLSHTRLPSAGAPSAVEPPPSTETAHSNLRLPNLPEPSVIAPPPALDAATRNLGQMNMAHLDPQVDAPKLPVPEQRAVPPPPPGQASGSTQASAVPPPPSIEGIGAGLGQRPAGQLVALGLSPADVKAPIETPNGSRKGEFMATPEGRPDAPGTPDIHTGSDPNVGGTAARGKGVANAPPGISVSPAPAGHPTAAVAGDPAAASPVHTPAANANAFRQAMMASLRPPNLTDIPRTSSNDLPSAPKVVDQVFAGKKYYTMTLNMPNLNSWSGSWVIRFAELGEAEIKGELTAPVATLKVDPAYPAEMMREHVQGTVTLYAVIHKDGSVGEVKVLRGIDQRLDENARVALGRWRFRPGTKNGGAVDLEAVVQIPFMPRPDY